MRISLKLAASFAVMATLVGVVGYWSGKVQRQVESELARLSRSAIVNVVDAADMSDALSSAHMLLQELLRQPEFQAPQTPPDEDVRRLVRRQRDTIETHLNDFRRGLERSRLARESWMQETSYRDAPGPSGGPTLADLGELADAFDKHRAMTNQLLELRETDPASAYTQFDERLDPHFHTRLLPLILKIRREAEADFTRGVRSAERGLAHAKTRRHAITLASLAVAVGLGLLVAWSIGRPLTTLTHATAEIAAGRLDTRVDLRSHDEVGRLARSFNHMAASLQSKTVAKSYVDHIIGSMRDMLVVTDQRDFIRHVNPAVASELGFTEDELVGQPLSRVWDAASPATNAPSGPAPENWGTRECCWKTKSGSSLPVSCTNSPLHDDQGTVQGIVCVATNISERKAAEEQLRASLREKDVLLKEVHHRVKNNLQIISSLLNLQSQVAPTSDAARALRESQGRIHSMSLIHQQLYRSDNLASIDFAEYVRDLTSHLAGSTGAAARAITVHVEVESRPLPIDLAIPCGMIVNELVTNAMEHAFPDGGGGEIRVGFRGLEDGEELRVSDNGTGFAPADGDAPDRPSLGLTVVRALTEQIGGTLRFESNGGTCCLIRFGKNSTP